MSDASATAVPQADPPLIGPDSVSISSGSPATAGRLARQRARVITDEGGLIFGVVVRLRSDDSEATAVAQAQSALMDHDRISHEDASACLARMHSTVQPFRWVPRDDGIGVRPHLEEADAGSRGSWLGIYWAYPH